MDEDQERVADTPAAAPAEIKPTPLPADVECLRAELEATQDRALRARAEAENARRRAEIDVVQAHKYAIERFAAEMISVRDSLELARAIDLKHEHAAAVQKMHEGLDLTLKLMDDAFRKFALTLIDPKGEKFDPAQHHAISLIESDQVPPQHVAAVMQKGYLLHDRVLRPAMVVVAKAKDSEGSRENT